MAQYNFGTIDPYVVDGVQLAGIINNWRDAIHSMHRGPARPSYVVPGQMWIDDAGGATNWIVKVNRTAAADVSLFTINTSTGVISIIDGMNAVTQATANSTTLLATTAFVQAAITAAVSAATSALIPPGTVVDMAGALTVAPTGWVLAMQGTIGNAASAATIRANADTVNLFTHLWTMNNIEAPVSGGRGGSAAADYAANKTIGGLDFRGRVRATWDSLGGTAAGVLPGFPRSGIVGGASAHTLVIGELPDHFHFIAGGNIADANGNRGRFAFSDGTAASNVQSGPNSDYGANGASHNNTQPTRTVTTVIKL